MRAGGGGVGVEGVKGRWVGGRARVPPLAPGLMPPIRLTGTLWLPSWRRSGDTEMSGRRVSLEVIPSR